MRQTSPDADGASVPLDGAHLDDLSNGDIRAFRARLRRERDEIQAAAISGGPTQNLCERMNALAEKEHLLARAERRQRDRRAGVVRGLWESLRL